MMSVIAIDGPAGSGKSTVAKIVAQRLGWLHVDTGAMYRAIALACLNQSLEMDDVQAIGDLALTCKLKFVDQKMHLNGADVSEQIREPRIGPWVSKVAAVAQVRECLLDFQRSFAEQQNIVMEGRDIGSVVFPEAQYKFYLDASVDQRVSRRLKELLAKGLEVNEPDIRADVIRRDESDKNRAISPLVCCEDAQVIDTSDLSIEQVVDVILKVSS